MTSMRFNHLELTMEPGVLDDAGRRALSEFYGDLFGWTGMDVYLFDQSCLFLEIDDDHFILCAEGDDYMRAPGYDHLGLLLDNAAAVEECLAKAKEWQTRDSRVQINDAGPPPNTKPKPNGLPASLQNVKVRAFKLKFMLPIWFDVQSIQRLAPAPA
jgi:hypothetical protein